MLSLLDKLYQTNRLAQSELCFMLTHLNEHSTQVLFDYALQTRIRYYGNKVYFRGLIEFSNHCRKDCLYCGIRASNTKVPRYRLTSAEILQCCRHGYDLGYRTFVLQSGEDLWYTYDVLAGIIRAIKEDFPEAAITLSIGERTQEEYQALFTVGADRFLMRHETASQRLYDQLHPTMKFENRRACLQTLQRIGYQVGAGFMVGLPGQTAADLAEDLLYLQGLGPEMAGIGPFIPHSETPLKDETGGTVEETLVMVALTRLLLPDCLIPATTALGTLHPKGRELALRAGANVVMPSLTPTRVRKLYQLYEDKICLEEDASRCRFCLENKVHAAGLEADFGRGDSWRFERKRKQR